MLDSVTRTILRSVRSPWPRWLLPAALLATGFVLATTYVTKGRYPATHSFTPNVIWAHEWSHQFSQGVWYPRWMQHAWAGLGSPSFHFYGPLCMYAVLPFTVGLGLPATEGVLYSSWVALLTLGTGVCVLSRRTAPDAPPWAPALAGVLAMLSPYALYNVYVRGALAETWAMAIFPWLVDALLQSLQSVQLRARLSLVAFTALFALCHPPLLLLGCLAIVVGVVVVSRGWLSHVRWIRRVAIPLGVGLALDATYLFSAILDQRHADIDALNRGNDVAAQNRLLVFDLSRFSPRAAEGFDGDLVPAFVLGLSFTVAAAVQHLRRREASNDGSERALWLVVVGFVSLFMMTDLSAGLYELYPLLNRIQFSWRWLSILTVVTSVLWVLFVRSTMRVSGPGKALARLLALLVTVWALTQAFSSTMKPAHWSRRLKEETDQGLARMKPPPQESDAAAQPHRNVRGLLEVNANGELLFFEVPEYLPKVRKESGFPPRTFPTFEWTQGEGKVLSQVWLPRERRFEVESRDRGEALIRTVAWPGWALEVNDTRVPTEAGDDWGRVRVPLPRGRARVRLSYAGTDSQRLGNLVSLLTALGILAHAGLTLRRRKLSARLAQAD